MSRFGELFRKYRLRSEFSTLCALGDVLADKGYNYDLSIFSHWQNGKRIPSQRKVVLTLIEIFLNYKGLLSLDAANEFLESAGHGYLTSKEQEALGFQSIFPRQDFSDLDHIQPSQAAVAVQE